MLHLWIQCNHLEISLEALIIKSHLRSKSHPQYVKSLTSSKTIRRNEKLQTILLTAKNTFFNKFLIFHDIVITAIQAHTESDRKSDYKAALLP